MFFPWRRRDTMTEVMSLPVLVKSLVPKPDLVLISPEEVKQTSAPILEVLIQNMKGKNWITDIFNLTHRGWSTVRLLAATWVSIWFCRWQKITRPVTTTVDLAFCFNFLAPAFFPFLEWMFISPSKIYMLTPEPAVWWYMEAGGLWPVLRFR